MSIHWVHNFERYSAAFTPPASNLNLRVGGELGFAQRKSLERMTLGFTTIVQRCTRCGKRRTITRTGDLRDIE